MAGDRSTHDGAAADVGITILLLPPRTSFGSRDAPTTEGRQARVPPGGRASKVQLRALHPQVLDL